MPTGHIPSRVAFRIAMRLEARSIEVGHGEAPPEGVGYAVSGIFSPDASYYSPASIDSMRFIPGPPTFAVEVRSENDYGPTAEIDITAKRDDYFEADTLVVWDVDCEVPLIRFCRPDHPEAPEIFRSVDFAHAEPALPDWRVAVDRIFA